MNVTIIIYNYIHGINNMSLLFIKNYCVFVIKNSILHVSNVISTCIQFFIIACRMNEHNCDIDCGRKEGRNMFI